MKDTDTRRLSWDEWDEFNDPRPADSGFDRVVERALSRRGFLGGVIAFGSGAAVMGAGTLLSAPAAEAAEGARFAFAPIPAQTDNTVHVPEGYSWKPLVKWGDPLFSDAPVFDHATGGSVQGSDRIFGENTDGMELFEIGGHQVIAVNHEYANPEVNLPHSVDGVPATAEEVAKLQNLQGVAVFEIAEPAQR